MEQPTCKTIELYEIKPGDRLVVTLDRPMPRHYVDDMVADLRKWSGLPEGRIAVLQPGMRMAVVRQEEAT